MLNIQFKMFKLIKNMDLILIYKIVGQVIKVIKVMLVIDLRYFKEHNI